MSGVTWPERVGGRLAARVHERGSGLAWGTREIQGCCCARSFGRRGREEGWSSRCSTSVSVQSKGDGGGWVSPKRLAGGAAWSVGFAYPTSEWRRGERGVGRDLGKILCMHGSGFPLLLLFLKILNKVGLGWY
jgi:hypothetical protein